ncbi:MAG: hypothetical protein D0530_00645 [Methylococcales bacterium]|nr:MAG: hypothetical protein D0530_00645 [Methylococcales bacterium]
MRDFVELLFEAAQVFVPVLRGDAEALFVGAPMAEQVVSIRPGKMAGRGVPETVEAPSVAGTAMRAGAGNFGQRRHVHHAGQVEAVQQLTPRAVKDIGEFARVTNGNPLA